MSELSFGGAHVCLQRGVNDVWVFALCEWCVNIEVWKGNKAGEKLLFFSDKV